MAFANDDVYQISVVGSYGTKPAVNVWYVRVVFASDPGITAPQLGEAFWNHVKAEYRQVATTNWATAFTEIRVEQCDVPAGMYGLYSVPLGEQPGLRVGGTTGQESPLPIFNAAGARLNVGSKLTRPGQKRFYGLAEGDSAAGTLQAPARAAVIALGAKMTSTMILGAPALLTELETVVRKTAPLDVASPNQRVVSMSVPVTVRSQVSRRPRAF